MESSKISIKDILAFVQMLNDFREVERVVKLKGSDRGENDSEHSYGLAMLTWYLIEGNDLKLDLNKAVRYALVHDLVEVYAGDTFIYDADESYIDSKHDREKEALEKLKKEFPEASGLFTWIDAYEKRADEEAKFVYALDKLHPIYNIYLSGGRSWKEKRVSWQDLWDHKRDKVKLSPEVERLFSELMELLKGEEGGLFPKKI
ncbi:MAG: hypothetical protein COU09_02245 [Candidatus Harrisonbacteria bacterium CG10_big_fil_rev_8_21_14_0_10_44_23]|uniref:5'-deoxynucleotidase n=1 Tax=Candidatus Harrisonbacteria bacterium CG10_big_fil_rev_8_21_14_0_10_44_23 TaxID=1974585 RepID=A0A2H0UPW5_9BACT|nr:MAG: hypothetical protein COU09_02245 [Candidatus Harrisonbacteria bacterium CG10_big_fil_rev_8_21_14_0_10_44_23]